MSSKGPGRPPGRSQKGRARERHLYETALRLFAQQGYTQTTLRQIARAADVSPGLMYRYFDGKEAVVLRLYTELSVSYAARVGTSPQSWSDGVSEAVQESLAVLAPHRPLLQSLMGILVSPADGGVFSEDTRAARARVMQAFERAVTQATDAPSTAIQRPLARLCYLGHLGVILFWLLDRSEQQKATERLVEGIRRHLGRVRWMLRLPGAQRLLGSLDEVVWSGLLGDQHRSEPVL